MWKKVQETVLLLFIFLLPLKFTQTLGIPGSPAFYWGDFFSLLYMGWSPHVFALTAGILLSSYVLTEGFRRKQASVQMLLWLLLAFVSLAGCLRASCWEYVRQTVDVLFGLSCFAGALHLAVQEDKEKAEPFLNKIITSAVCSAAITVFYGWDQLLTGLQAVRDYVEAYQLSGTFSNALNNQILSNRIYGTFQLCNTYAGYLAALLPFLIQFTLERVPLTKPAKWLTGGMICILVGVPLVMTGSRGALLSLGVGVFFTAFFLTKKKKLMITGAVLTGLLMAVLIVCWRGAGSMIFRLDYDWAAFRMMLEHPFSGTGWGDFFHEYPGKKLLHNDEAPHSPHNLVLFFGSQCGVIGFLLAGMISFYPLYRGFRKLKQQDGGIDWHLAALLTSLTILTFDAQLEVGIESPAYACTQILLSTLVLHRTGQGNQTVLLKKQLPPFRHAGLILLAGLAIGTAAIEIGREKKYAALFEKVYPQFSRTPDVVPKPEEIRRAYAEAPQDSPFVHLVMTSFLERNGQFSAALRAIDLSAQLAPEDTGIKRRRLRLLRLTGSDPAAIEAERESILKADPNNPDNSGL